MKFVYPIIILLFLGCSNNKNSECDYINDYYPLINKGELEFYLGNYEKAFIYYEKAFKKCGAIKIGTHHDTDKFAKICAKLGKINLATEYIEKAVEKGSTLNQFLRDEAFNETLESEKGKEIISTYDKKRKNYINGLNLSLRAEIQQMIEMDQSLVDNQRKRDSVFKVNDKRLVEIFEEYGYPNEQIVGNYAFDQINSDPYILLLHSGDSIRKNYFILKVKEFVKNGTCPPFVLGSMIDNLLLFHKKPQEYGTYKTRNKGYANMINDTSKVNKNRIQIGLPTLKMSREIDSLKLL